MDNDLMNGLEWFFWILTCLCFAAGAFTEDFLDIGIGFIFLVIAVTYTAVKKEYLEKW